jgi:hypothetical protein
MLYFSRHYPHTICIVLAYIAFRCSVSAMAFVTSAVAGNKKTTGQIWFTAPSLKLFPINCVVHRVYKSPETRHRDLQYLMWHQLTLRHLMTRV